MNQAECQRIIDEYLSWLKHGLSTESLEGSCELTTPFLDRHNDHLQVYVERVGDKLILSDDGYVLSDLGASGLEFNTPKRRLVLEATLNGLGVKQDERRIYTEASLKNVGQRLHSLIQALLAVDDMFMMAQPRVASIFWEDVRAFLDANEVRYSPRVKLAGKTGFDHSIDFLIPASKKSPERVVQAINAPSKNTIGAYLFSLTDTRDARGGESKALAFLNDTARDVGGEIIEALDAYSVTPALWSKRELYLPELAA